jgi:glycolate oxidase FAD binding subunit
MSEVTFKVLPAPPETCSLLLAGLAREQAFAALRRALGSAYDVAGAAYLPARTAALSTVAAVAAAGADLAVLRLEGLTPSVRYRARALQQLLTSAGATVDELAAAPSLALWRELRDVALLPGELTLWRVSTAPAAGPGLIEELERQLELAWLADWAGGLLWLAVPGAQQGGPEDGGAAAIRGALAGPLGHATLVRGSPELRAAVPVFQPQEAALARLTARVKDSFDPKRILNRGRMYAEA